MASPDFGSRAPENIARGLPVSTERGRGRFSLVGSLVKRAAIGALLYGGVTLVAGEIGVELFKDFPMDTDPAVRTSQETIDWARYTLIPTLAFDMAVTGSIIGAATALGEGIYRRIRLAI